ncbi:hypothetical protein FKW77_006639 [Venturia effusa]|uniref:WD40 repeat-like protein n=1 Tax=Venturia effusa TaxID=50376 RepID=A0A517L5K1_9PEZI|nr:hypothetical protein FKW77_006639 [Venturia effusa]
MSSRPTKRLKTEPSAAHSALLRRLLCREIGYDDRFSKIRGIYADYRFVKGLDIVNELSGHRGCVNALDWSPSGELLASGSDDTYVRLYEYLPRTSTDQFKLRANIATGHRANIFSVKFMPHTDERTIVTASADCEARVIDIEGSVPNGKFRRLRTHNGPVKRIITEDSPYYFLTCSEDGTVRQWDTRVDLREVDEDWPHPLISYARYNIELRTISCSPRQPHYIALGGDHLHCFLHDRRMSGRDKLRERGGLLRLGKATNTTMVEEATRCVRKFAPEGKQRMTKFDSGGLITYGHGITACKISDANPNELLVSWSDDKIYTFDMLRGEQNDHVAEEARIGENMSRRETSVVGSELDGSIGKGLSSYNYDGRYTHQLDIEDDTLITHAEHASANDSSDEDDTPPWFVNMSARKNVPCGSHSRSYSGHVNVQTIKDVNYFGLQDEYVVSGSDCGHVFIWNKKSSEITTILHADEDIVNIVEPHPYEPTIAVSGIDNTIKIFSADARDRERAVLNKGIYASTKHRTEATLINGFRVDNTFLEEESFGSRLANGPYGTDHKGLQSRRRVLDLDDLDNPPRHFFLNYVVEQDDTSEREEFEQRMEDEIDEE